MAAAFVSVALMSPTEASAFCRTTTCAPERQSCSRDAHGCIAEGDALRWPADGCVQVGLDLGSAVDVDFDPAAVQAVVDAARARWTSADCGGGAQPSLCLLVVAACGPVDAPIRVRFRAPTAPHADSARLAQTQVHFAPDGTIERAEVEIDAGDQPLTLEDEHVGYDLTATVIHELGHALGLDHTDQPDAAMFDQPRYGQLSGRTLSEDDAAAVCAVYPPDPDAQSPRPSAQAESTAAPVECDDPAPAPTGCTAAGSAPSSWLSWLVVLALIYARSTRSRRWLSFSRHAPPRVLVTCLPSVVGFAALNAAGSAGAIALRRCTPTPACYIGLPLCGGHAWQGTGIDQGPQSGRGLGALSHGELRGRPLDARAA